MDVSRRRTFAYPWRGMGVRGHQWSRRWRRSRSDLWSDVAGEEDTCYGYDIHEQALCVMRVYRKNQTCGNRLDVAAWDSWAPYIAFCTAVHRICTLLYCMCTIRLSYSDDRTAPHRRGCSSAMDDLLVKQLVPKFQCKCSRTLAFAVSGSVATSRPHHTRRRQFRIGWPVD